MPPAPPGGPSPCSSPSRLDSFRYSAPELIPIIFAAILAGAVYGYRSPISDTTILSSAGAGCNHIDHVSTQLPYATLAAGCCFVGFFPVAGFTANALLTLAVAVALLLLSTAAP